MEESKDPAPSTSHDQSSSNGMNNNITQTAKCSDDDKPTTKGNGISNSSDNEGSSTISFSTMKGSPKKTLTVKTVYTSDDDSQNIISISSTNSEVDQGSITDFDLHDLSTEKLGSDSSGSQASEREDLAAALSDISEYVSEKDSSLSSLEFEVIMSKTNGKSGRSSDDETQGPPKKKVMYDKKTSSSSKREMLNGSTKTPAADEETSSEDYKEKEDHETLKNQRGGKKDTSSTNYCTTKTMKIMEESKDPAPSTSHDQSSSNGMNNNITQTAKCSDEDKPTTKGNGIANSSDNEGSSTISFSTMKGSPKKTLTVKTVYTSDDDSQNVISISSTISDVDQGSSTDFDMHDVSTEKLGSDSPGSQAGEREDPAAALSDISEYLSEKDSSLSSLEFEVSMSKTNGKSGRSSDDETQGPPKKKVMYDKKPSSSSKREMLNGSTKTPAADEETSSEDDKETEDHKTLKNQRGGKKDTSSTNYCTPKRVYSNNKSKETEKSAESNSKPGNKEIDLNNEDNSESKSESHSENVINTQTAQLSRSEQLKKCPICLQRLNDPKLEFYKGHPNNAVEEEVALTNPKLSLFTDSSAGNMDIDLDQPQNKITYFTVYDKNGHLCNFDTGLIEKDALLFFSGYVKPIYEEDSTTEGGIPTKDMGPINEWFFGGFDGGEKAIIAFNTPYGDYYLMEPSTDYAPFMKSVLEKVYLSKKIIEFLQEEEKPEFEDLVNYIQTIVPPPGIPLPTEESLMKHAQFICEQVVDFDKGNDGDDNELISLPCMVKLVKLVGVRFTKLNKVSKYEQKTLASAKNKFSWSKATTTPLVRNFFETIFPDQIDDNVKLDIKRQRCKVCEFCQLPDCGSCKSCRDMKKFGGPGKLKRGCTQRKCPNMVVAGADFSEPEDEDEYEANVKKINKTEEETHRIPERLHIKTKPVEWIGEPIFKNDRRTYYSSAKVGSDVVNIGDFIACEPANPIDPLAIGQIKSLSENMMGDRGMHILLFLPGNETSLGETGDPHELFCMYQCENTLLGSMSHMVEVEKLQISPNWMHEGGQPAPPEENQSQINDRKFYWRQSFIEKYGRFEDHWEDLECLNKDFAFKYCISCEYKHRRFRYDNPHVDEVLNEKTDGSKTTFGLVKYKAQEFRPGTCVFLNNTAFEYPPSYGAVSQVYEPDQVNSDKYPELYRKLKSTDSRQKFVAADPFCIGLITEIYVTSVPAALVTPSDIFIKVKKFFRPENIGSTDTNWDTNKILASNIECDLNFQSEVVGKCVVFYQENIDGDVYLWTKEGPNRFYFSDAWYPEEKRLIEPSKEFKLLGDRGKGAGKGRSKSIKRTVLPDKWPTISKPLACLDVFAGCGGLSEGLHMSGLAKTKWAIERDGAAAKAFKLNNPSTTVFTDDCNDLLKMVLNGESKNATGQRLPQKGEVELLVGGPPCQGFSGMNRFNSRQYSLFKNSLIVSYLSYCDYYRPRFFILENVRNFVSFKRSMVLKLTLRCLVKMGYQVTFGVLQAGSYGVPQTRKRAIILAAAPGEVLPRFPDPMYTFPAQSLQPSLFIDNKKYELSTYYGWNSSAPFRTNTVKDAMSDLPEIPSGHQELEMSYETDPESSLQKLLREGCGPMVRDHICKEMTPLVNARMAHIPREEGADWRDLPNIVVTLSDGTPTNQLVYGYGEKKNGKRRGVCPCYEGKECDPLARQFNTLIPWCLPHTGDRHNHWSGLYGRLAWEGYFKTTVTNPEPMGKQGKVLHPEQNRVVSVRECARSQGFPDRYSFFGTIIEKHRQIGNAVPPLMAVAIGREIIRSIATTQKPVPKD